MCTASSASSTWRASRSASEYTATVLMPILRAVWMTRQAISPRLAIRIFSNMAVSLALRLGGRWSVRLGGAGLDEREGADALDEAVGCAQRLGLAGVGGQFAAGEHLRELQQRLVARHEVARHPDGPELLRLFVGVR